MQRVLLLRLVVHKVGIVDVLRHVHVGVLPDNMVTLFGTMQFPRRGMYALG